MSRNKSFYPYFKLKANVSARPGKIIKPVNNYNLGYVYILNYWKLLYPINLWSWSSITSLN